MRRIDSLEEAQFAFQPHPVRLGKLQSSAVRPLFILRWNGARRARMLGVTIRPSLKFVKLSYLFCLLMAVALAVYIYAYPAHPETKQLDERVWGFLVPAIWLLFTIVRHIKRRLAKITILDDRLRYEAGLSSKSTRTVELVKVQDVRVDQTLWQRIFGIGDLSLETAGGTSRIEMDSIDNPQSAADHILSLARGHRATPEARADAGSGPAANPSGL